MHWHLSPYSIFPLITSVAYLTFGIYVLKKIRPLSSAVPYSLWCFTTVIWQGCMIFLLSIKTPEHALILVRIVYSDIVFIPVAFYQFIIFFLKLKEEYQIVWVAHLIALVFAITAWPDNLLLNGYYVYSWGYYPKAGPLLPAFLLFLTLICVRMLWLLHKQKMEINKASRLYIQTQYVQIALTIYITASADFAVNYGFNFYPPGFIVTLICLALITYAMVRHQLLEIHVIIRRTMIYSVICGLLLILYVGTVTVSSNIVQHLIGSQTVFFPIVLTCFITACLYPFTQRIQNYVDSLFQRRTLSDVSSGFAHEIKMPLSNISLPAELTYLDLESIKEGNKQIEELLPKIQERMKYIMDQARLASNRVEAVRDITENHPLTKQEINLASVIQDALATFQSFITKTQTEILFDHPDSLANVQGYPHQLEVLFTNLIKNALEMMSGMATNSLKRIVISIKEEKKWVCIHIHDTGPGIKPSDLPHVFDSHFSTKGLYGRGMGLSLCRQIVQSHGGTIQVKSEEGKGAEFIVRLPIDH